MMESVHVERVGMSVATMTSRKSASMMILRVHLTSHVFANKQTPYEDMKNRLYEADFSYFNKQGNIVFN